MYEQTTHLHIMGQRVHRILSKMPKIEVIKETCVYKEKVVLTSFLKVLSFL